MPKLKFDDCPRCKVTIKFEPIDGWICPKCRSIYCLLELPTTSCGTIIGSLTLQDVLNLPSKFWKDVPLGKPTI